MTLILLVALLTCTASLGFEILFSPPLTITAGSQATATWTRESQSDAATFTLQLEAQSGAEATPTTIDSQAQTTGEVVFSFPTPGTFNVQGWRQDPNIDIGRSNIIQVLAAKPNQPSASSTPRSRTLVQATPASSPVSTSVLLTRLPPSRQTSIVNTPLASTSPPAPTKVSETHRANHTARIIAAVIVVGIIFLAAFLFVTFRIRRRRQRIRQSRTAEFYREMIAQSHHSRLVSEGTIGEDKDSISAHSTQQPQTQMQSSGSYSNSSRSTLPSQNLNPFETLDQAPRGSEDSGSIVFSSLPRRSPPAPSFTFPMHPLRSSFPSPGHILAAEVQPGAMVVQSAIKSAKPSKSWFKEKRVSWKEDITKIHAVL